MRANTSKLLHGQIDVLPPGLWENPDGPKEWWAICDDDGIKAYAGSEELAWIIAKAGRVACPKATAPVTGGSNAGRRK
jgi:hypothetical protein